MKFSENWLREIVDVPVDRDALAHALTMAGLEVEDVTALGESLDHVVVAAIVSAEKHPEADRLQVCRVDAGLAEPLQIVCGAPNARVGIKVPLAMVGANLPGGIAIKAAKLRGVESNGMLCSAKELGIDADASGLLELPADAPVGQSLASYLGLPDASFEMKITPNRPDCLSVHGLAHDVAALFGGHVKPVRASSITGTGDARRAVRLEAGADAPRYLGRVVSGINPSARTPLWMAERLRRGGIRPISAVVDVTAYVMLELGQPMHAFDNDKLVGDVVVRHAREGELLTLLDGSEVKLDKGFLVIADDANALAAAGVMGGFDSRVTDATTNVFLESAHFAPPAIMGRARKLGLHTDASHRYERGVDPALPSLALDRATDLLLEIADGTPGPITVAERLQDIPRPKSVVLRRARLHRLLGLEVADAAVSRMLTALGMRVESLTDGWRVVAPSSRFDIEREEDLVEEVARIHGYDNIPTHRPSGALVLVPDPEERLGDMAVRGQLASRGWFEAVTLAFVDGELLERWGMGGQGVALANPLSAELAVMRPSLLPGLLQALAHNRARQQEHIRLFELARTYASDVETPRLGLVACGLATAEQWGVPARPMDLYDLKGDIEALIAQGGEPARWSFDATGLPAFLHPGRSARVLRNGKPAGFLGSLHPSLARALDAGDDILVAELDMTALGQRRLPRAAAIGKFPQVRRDIAVDMPEDVAWASAEAAVRAALGPTLREVRLFDRYVGKGVEAGRKSLAMGLILQDDSRTLTLDDADACVRNAVLALENTCKARLRG
jgi:phenylalanyl-tRNA synthetase beta chain